MPLIWLLLAHHNLQLVIQPMFHFVIGYNFFFKSDIHAILMSFYMKKKSKCESKSPCKQDLCKLQRMFGLVALSDSYMFGLSV
jgi:hypothetical protein